MNTAVKIISITWLMILTLDTYANSQIGIYLTVSDYLNKKLSYEVDCKIRLNNSILELPYITIKDHGKKLKMNKSDLYGYVGCDKKLYVLVEDEEFQVVGGGSISS